MYVDDLLEVSCHPEIVMNVLAKAYRLKEDPVTKKLFGKLT